MTDFHSKLEITWTKLVQKGLISTSNNVDTEALYRLAVCGLIAATEASQVEVLVHSNALRELVLPLEAKYTQDIERFRFNLVVLMEFLDEFVQFKQDQISLEEKKELEEMVLQVFFSLIKYQKYSLVHGLCIDFLDKWSSKASLYVAEPLNKALYHVFLEEIEPTTISRVNNEEEEQEGIPCNTISFGSLAKLLACLFKSNQALTDTWINQVKEICISAMTTSKSNSVLLRSISIHVLPSLLQVKPECSKEFMQVILSNCASFGVNTTRSTRKNKSKDHSLVEWLYLLCHLLPSDPNMLQEIKLQQLLCDALMHDDPLIRKQSIHLLNLGFEFYLTNNKQKIQENPMEKERMQRWQTFLAASEVIQMHRQQHLIEQVWPQVEQLIESCFFLTEDVHIQEDKTSTSDWPIQMNFRWIESLLHRVFCHENAVTRRLFLSGFMQVCVNCFNNNNKSVNKSKHSSILLLIDDASFHRFMYTRLLLVFNDPFLYRGAVQREELMNLFTQFYGSYLIMCLQQTSSMNSSSSYFGLDQYVASIREAIFGPQVSGNSPEALMAMLKVFENVHLQQKVVQQMCPGTSKFYLGEKGIEDLRFMLEVHVMKSFPHSMKMKLLTSLVNALSKGFVLFDESANSNTILLTIGRTLSVFPIAKLFANNFAAYKSLHNWLHGSFDNGWTQTMSNEFHAFLNGTSKLNPNQFARCLLFATTNVVMNSSTTTSSKVSTQQEDTKSEEEKFCFVLSQVFSLTKEKEERQQVSSRKHLVLTLLGHFAQELKIATTFGRQSFVFHPLLFYKWHPEQFTCQKVFTLGLTVAEEWLNHQHNKKVDDVDEDKEEETSNTEVDQLLEHVAWVLTQTSVAMLEEEGQLVPIRQLNQFCQQLIDILKNSSSKPRQITRAMRFLSIISQNPEAIDSMDIFSPHSILSILLTKELSYSSSTTTSRNRFTVSSLRPVFFESKWTLVYNVIQASSYVPTHLLKQVFDVCLDSIDAAGSDPTLLLCMVNVLSLSLAACCLLSEDGTVDIVKVEELFHAVYGAYRGCKSKLDTLTQGVIQCIFQPCFVLNETLNGLDTNENIMKKWFYKFLTFGEVHRPNVVFHLTTRLCTIWRAFPHTCVPFVKEIVHLLTYKEPMIGEKEQLIWSTSNGQQQAQQVNYAEDHYNVKWSQKDQVKNRFTRFVLLNFLEDIALETSNVKQHEQLVLLMDTLLIELLTLNELPEWQKQHMINSDGFGKKLRCWQALCVLSVHIRPQNVHQVNDFLWKAFCTPQLPEVRTYMELFAMRIGLRFPQETIYNHLTRLLNDFNLMPQVCTSLLLVAGYIVKQLQNQQRLTFFDDDNHHEKKMVQVLLNGILPWLNASHGHTRVIVQFLLAFLLPEFIHRQQQVVNKSCKLFEVELTFLERTIRFLSENKECKKMFRRQVKQFDKFTPEKECTLDGILTNAIISEYQDFFPNMSTSLTSQLKETMNEIYAKFQLEQFQNDMANRLLANKMQPVANENTSKPNITFSLDNFQRKIDTTNFLVEESSKQVSTCLTTKKQHQVILCASLVEKLPNVAGLARTCEIFQVTSLWVGNLRMCDEEMFENISVTANKWMQMDEVKEENLLDQLKFFKEQKGYTIVALEQTATSKCLSNFDFPDKIIIVLGKEKEGIPIEILEIVDVCVEIPQFGIIRSLNVHVSGAILLWEYVQQQILHKTNKKSNKGLTEK